MPTALELFRAIAPEFSTLTDAEVNIFIGMAVSRVSVSVTGTQLYAQIIAYLAAHLAALTTFEGGASTPVTGRRAGQEAINYSQVAILGDFDLTAYGREYKALVKGLARVKPLTTSNCFRL